MSIRGSILLVDDEEKILKTLGRAKVAANGAFAFKAKIGTFFRARAVAAPGAAPQLCDQLRPLISTVPCVNPTVNGFDAVSKVARKKK